LDLALMGDWTRRCASLFGEVIVHNMTVTLQCNSNTAAPGLMVAFIDPDPDINYAGYSTGVSLIQAAYAAVGHKDDHIYGKIVVKRPGTGKTMKWVKAVAGGDQRLTSFGTFVVVNTTSQNITNDLGVVTIKYDLTFLNPGSTATTALADMEGAVTSSAAGGVSFASLASPFNVLSDWILGTVSGSGGRSSYLQTGQDDIAVVNSGAATGANNKGIALKPGAYEITVDVIADTIQANAISVLLALQGCVGIVTGEATSVINPTRTAGTFDGITDSNYGGFAQYYIQIPEAVNYGATYDPVIGVTTPSTTQQLNAGSGYGWVDIAISAANWTGKLKGIYYAVRKLAAASDVGNTSLFAPDGRRFNARSFAFMDGHPNDKRIKYESPRYSLSTVSSAVERKVDSPPSVSLPPGFTWKLDPKGKWALVPKIQ